MEDRAEARIPWSHRACDGFVLAFALWTLSCNLTVIQSGGLMQAAFTFLGAGTIISVGLWSARKRRPTTEARGESTASRIDGARLLFPWTGAILLTLGWVTWGATVPLWCATILFFLLAAVLEWKADATAPEGLPSATTSRAKELLLWLLAIAAACLPLFAHKPSPDDTYYINVAVAAADEPNAPILRYDTLHGIPDAPIMHAAYRVNSYELLAGVMAWLTPLTAIEATHLVLPVLFSFFLVLAQARFLKLIAPRSWLFLLIATLAILALVGETNQFHANFAFLRMTQGKAALLSLFLPLTAFWAVRFAQADSASGKRNAWCMLLASQVACIGASSTALWCAPIVAALALAGGLPRKPDNRASLSTLLAGIGASVYVVLAGALVYARSLTESDHAEATEGVHLVSNTAEPITTSPELARAAWDVVFGTGAVSVVGLIACLGAWSTVRSGVLRRALLLLSAGTFLFLANPFAALPVARYITGDSTYWRVFWVLPVPALIAVLLSAPYRLAAPRLRKAGAAFSLVLVALFVGVAPTINGLSEDNTVRWEPFILNAPPQAFEPARIMVEASEPGQYVLAPKHLAAWIPTFHGRPHTLVTREHYLYLQRAYLTPEELELRIALCNLVGGIGPEGGEAFELMRRGIERFDFACVAFLHASKTANAVRAATQQAGYAMIGKNSRYELWSPSKGR